MMMNLPLPLLLTVVISSLTSHARSCPLALPAQPNTEDPLSMFHVFCAERAQWITPEFNPTDCHAALVELLDQKVFPEMADTFTFTSAGIYPPSPFVQQILPQRYVARTCTVALVMFSSFPPNTPGIPLDPTVPTADQATYDLLFAGATTVQRTCLSPVFTLHGNHTAALGSGVGVNFFNPTGWTRAGPLQAIGVFLWATDSEIDRIV